MRWARFCVTAELMCPRRDVLAEAGSHGLGMVLRAGAAISNPSLYSRVYPESTYIYKAEPNPFGLSVLILESILAGFGSDPRTAT